MVEEDPVAHPRQQPAEGPANCGGGREMPGGPEVQVGQGQPGAVQVKEKTAGPARRPDGPVVGRVDRAGRAVVVGKGPGPVDIHEGPAGSQLDSRRSLSQLPGKASRQGCLEGGRPQVPEGANGGGFSPPCESLWFDRPVVAAGQQDRQTASLVGNKLVQHKDRVTKNQLL